MNISFSSIEPSTIIPQDESHKEKEIENTSRKASQVFESNVKDSLNPDQDVEKLFKRLHILYCDSPKNEETDKIINICKIVLTKCAFSKKIEHILQFQSKDELLVYLSKSSASIAYLGEGDEAALQRLIEKPEPAFPELFENSIKLALSVSNDIQKSWLLHFLAQKSKQFNDTLNAEKIAALIPLSHIQKETLHMISQKPFTRTPIDPVVETNCLGCVIL